MNPSDADIKEIESERREILYCCLSCKACGKPVNVDTSELCAQCEIEALKSIPTKFRTGMMDKMLEKRLLETLLGREKETEKWTPILMDTMYGKTA